MRSNEYDPTARRLDQLLLHGITLVSYIRMRGINFVLKY